MEVTIKGEPKEIAALVLELQGQQEIVFDEASFSAKINRHQAIQAG